MEINLNLNGKYDLAFNPNTNKLNEHFKAKYQSSPVQTQDTNRNEVVRTGNILSLYQLEEIYLQEQRNIEILDYAIGLVQNVENDINQAKVIMDQDFKALNNIKSYLINLHVKRNHQEVSLNNKVESNIVDQNSNDDQCLTS